jgi:hypothetical protein
MFCKEPYDCQPLQFYGHNFTAMRTANQGSFVDVSEGFWSSGKKHSKLHTLAVTPTIFGISVKSSFTVAQKMPSKLNFLCISDILSVGKKLFNLFY